MLNRQKTYQNTAPKLYLVTTPIGNYDDMTFRAVETLKKVDLIYCEDTRITSQLLSHFDIHTPLKSYNVMTENDLTEGLIKQIKNGKEVAVVSDAGMPGISDPGYLACRKAIDENIDVAVIPAASASLTALTGSGLASRSFKFVGFLPPKKNERIKVLKELVDDKDTLIIYEAPHRIEECLHDMLDIFGNRNICLARELTKKYEEYVRGKISEVIEILPELKGEMVVICEGTKLSSIAIELNNLTIEEHYNYYLNQGIDYKEAMKLVAKDRNISKSDVYNVVKK